MKIWHHMIWQSFFALGPVLMLVEFGIIFADTLLLFFASLKSRGGGVVIISPFPVVYGSDKESVKHLLVLAMVVFSIGRERTPQNIE